MARGKKTGGRNFKKGQKPNPLGAKAHNPEKKIIKKLLKEDFTSTIEMMTQSTPRQLKEIAENPNTTIDKVIMASALIKSVAKGDVSPLIQLTEIVIGKPKEHVEHSVKNPHAHMTDEQLDQEIKQLESTTKIGERDVTPRPEEIKKANATD